MTDDRQVMENLRVLGDRMLDVASTACAMVSDDDGVFYTPVISIFAVEDGMLIGTTVHLDSTQDVDEVARLLRLTADAIDGRGVNKGRMQ